MWMDGQSKRKTGNGGEANAAECISKSRMMIYSCVVLAPSFYPTEWTASICVKRHMVE